MIDWLDLRSQRHIFGDSSDSTIELAGRVIAPEYQNRGIGTRMLTDMVLVNQPEHLVTYTRNPAIIAMMRRVCSEVLPIDLDTELTEVIENDRHATVIDGVRYHVDRYGPEGLFGGEDPANRSIEADGQPLKEIFPGLMSVRNALVVAARVREREHT